MMKKKSPNINEGDLRKEIETLIDRMEDNAKEYETKECYSKNDVPARVAQYIMLRGAALGYQVVALKLRKILNNSK